MNGELKAAKTVEGTINTTWIRYIEGTEIVKTVNGVHPDSDSNLELTPSDIGALPKNSKAVSAASADKLSGTITFTGTAETLEGKKQYSVADLGNGSKIDLSSIIGLKTVNGKSPDSDGNVQIESTGAAIDDLDYSTNTTWSSQHINEIQPKKLREEIEATCFKVEDEKDIHITVPSKTWLSNSNMIRITSYSSSLDSISLEKTFGLNIYVYVEGESTFYTRYYIPKDNISALVSFPITTVMSILWLGIYQGEDDKHYMTYDRIRDYTAANVQSDWNVTDTSSDAYIKNKPVIPEAVTEDIICNWGFTKNLGTVTSVNGISPDENGKVSLSTYDEAVQNKRTCFTIKAGMVDTDRSYTDYEEVYSSSGNYAPSFYLFLKDNYTFDKDKQYLFLDFFTDILNLNDGTRNVYNSDADVIIYNADGSELVGGFTIYGATSSSYYENEYDFVDCIAGYHFYYLNGSWNIDQTGGTKVSTLTYTDNSEKGYLYIPGKNKAIDEILENGTDNSLAFLNDSGKIPESQLPSYVDDVLEYSGKSLFPETGESGKIYIDTSTNLMYRWSGSTYVNTNTSLALGETSSTAYRGDRGKTAYEHSQSAHAPSNAEANVIDTVKVNGNTVTPSAKAVDITVPTKVSELENDEGYLTDKTFSEATTSKAGLMPSLSGNSEQYLNGNGEWATPASSGETPSVYQQKITKTTAKTPFELTQSNVDSSKCYFEYYGDSGSPCQLNVYLASGVTFDPDTQYIIPCSTPLFNNIIYDDLVSNPSTYSTNENNECTYGNFYFYLYSNDGTLIAYWDSVNGCSSTTKITFTDSGDFLGDIPCNYYITKGTSTYIATNLSEISGDYLIGNTDVLIPYAGGYLYEESEGGYIDFLLSCANNNNALSTRMYKFGVTTSPSAGIGQDISLKENTKYKFSACVKVVSGTVSQISLYIANSTGTKSTIGMKNLDISTNGIISFEFTTGSDLTNFKRCYVYNGRYNQTTSRQVLLYNMMIKEI